MSDKMKTIYHQAEGTVQYAQIFEQNRDQGTNGVNVNVDKARKKTDGLYKVMFTPKDEETKARMSEGLSDPMFMGHPRWRDGAVMLTRKHVDPSGVADFGGAPEVVHFSEGRHNDKWDYDNDGPIWNGAKVVIKYTTYGEGESQTVRLLKVGVIENGEEPEDYEPVDGVRF